MIEIKNCKIEIEKTQKYDAGVSKYDVVDIYNVKLNLPVPGGTLIYKILIDKAQYDSLQFANRLITEK
jgi:hypothetical protein